MKKIFYFGSLLASLLTSVGSMAQINYPGGRVAMSFDGNIEDDDDIVALPLSMALMDAAGLKDKVVHVEYSNNKCGGPNTVQEDNNDVAAFGGNDAVHMRNSASGSITRYSYSAALFYDHTTNATEAVAHLASEINLSTATNPLYIIAAGPMETVWRALNASDKTKHTNVFVISHSGWNQNYARCSASSHNWNALKSSFPNVYYVQNGTSATDPHQLADQNGGLNTAISAWDWMKNSADANLKWIHSRNPFSGKFDPSDAGMVYYLITGGPLKGGKKKPTVTDVKNLLTNPVVVDGNQAPDVSITSPVANSNFPVGTVVSVAATASDADGSIASVKFTSGTSNITDTTSPYNGSFTFTTAGSYTISATATDNKGKTKTTSVQITIGTVATGIPAVSFLQPLNNASVTKNIVVKVQATDSDGSISNVKLYLDDVFIRQEGVTPYVWNSTNGGSLDPVLSNLSPGTHQLKAVATDNSGKTNAAVITITVTSAARETELEELSTSNSNVYPNPFKDRLTIQTSGDFENEVTLINSEGLTIIVPVRKDGSQITLATETLHPGIYQLHYSDTNGSHRHTIVKQ